MGVNMETLEIKERMIRILKQLEDERKQGGGIKFERLIKYYYPLFVEYGAMRASALIEYENRLQECNEHKNIFVICTLGSSFEWHKINFWRKTYDLPSLEQVNEHEKSAWPWE